MHDSRFMFVLLWNFPCRYFLSLMKCCFYDFTGGSKCEFPSDADRWGMENCISRREADGRENNVLLFVSLPLAIHLNSLEIFSLRMKSDFSGFSNFKRRRWGKYLIRFMTAFALPSTLILHNCILGELLGQRPSPLLLFPIQQEMRALKWNYVTFRYAKLFISQHNFPSIRKRERRWMEAESTDCMSWICELQQGNRKMYNKCCQFDKFNLEILPLIELHAIGFKPD